MELNDRESRLRELGVQLRRKDSSWFFRALGRVWPWILSSSWTTTRLPGGPPVIWYPAGVGMPQGWGSVIDHELHHVRQLAPWWGPWLLALMFVLPLPALLSGRWFIERRAYAREVRRGILSPADAAALLWDNYGWPWPRSWMVAWFERQRDDERWGWPQSLDPSKDPLF